MDVFYAYTYSTGAWLGIQALPLLVYPKLVITLLANEGHQSSDIEIYLSRSLGLSLSVLGLIVLFFTGTIPLSSSIAGPAIRLDEISTTNDPKAPYAVPILRVTALFHFSCAVYCYMRYVNVAQTGFLLGSVGYGALACMGSWCMIFGTSSGHTSKRTGADKRTMGFPFKNSNAYDKKKDRKLG